MIRMIKKKLSEFRFRKVLAHFMEQHEIVDNASPLVLVWELGGFSRILAKNAILSKALNLRGYNTHLIICDGTPEACIQRELELKESVYDWPKRCNKCFTENKSEAIKYSMDYSLAGEYIIEGKIDEFRKMSQNIELEEIKSYKYSDVKVGELAWSSVIRYMKGYLTDVSELDNESELIYRKYFMAVLINTFIANQAINKYNPVGILTSHGVYVDYAPPVFIGVKKNINTICWSSGFAEFLHYFNVPKRIDRLDLRGMSDKEWEKRANKELTKEENIRLDNYLQDRYFKSKARDIPNHSEAQSIDDLKQKLGINNDNKIACLFAHINWDAGFDLSPTVFETANKWVVETIKKMMQIKNVNWLVKVHPGELIDGSLYTTYDLINDFFKQNELPENIKILSHNVEMNSYSVYNLVDIGITIFGTVGTELPLLGKPIIATGEAHFSGKGFSIDVKTKEEYFSILEKINEIPMLNEEQINLVRKYAYSYFIQRQIPINIIKKEHGHWGDIDIKRIEELLPGKDLILDKICESIVQGKDVIIE